MGGYNAYGAGGWDGSALADMLPVALRSDGEHLERTFALHLTPAGKNHDVFAGCVDMFAGGGERLRLDGANKVAGLAAGGTALAVHPTERANGERLPLVASRRYGGGLVLSVMADTTWKWKFQVEAKGMDSPYYRFWRQSLRWLAGRKEQDMGGKELLHAWPNKLQYKPGETVLLEARAKGPDKEPEDEARVEAEIHFPRPIQKVSPRGEKYTVKSEKVTLQHIPLSLGEYQHSFRPSIGGIYRAVVSASVNGNPLGQTEFEFVVGEVTTEFDRVDVDELALRSIAGETGAKFHTFSSAARIARQLEQRRRRVTYQRELNLWNAPGFFLIFLGCVALEWILRKRSALS
jgi:hypothetical protein